MMASRWRGHDFSFHPDVSLCGGGRVSGPGWTMEAIPTPGHTSNHLCYALTDPLLASGMPQAGTNKPKIVSARFVKLFTAETYKRIKRDFHRMHFQYLMAAELPGDYDYFLITAGDRSLADRFSHIPCIGRIPDKGRQ